MNKKLININEKITSNKAKHVEDDKKLADVTTTKNSSFCSNV